jgi:hypothetical protein
MKKYITYLKSELSEMTIATIWFLIQVFVLVACVSIFILFLIIVPRSLQDVVGNIIKYGGLTILAIALIIVAILILSAAFEFIKKSIVFFKGAKND